MIKLTDLAKSYDKKKFAVKDLSLEIHDGEIFGFLGPNGAGKTTTLKMITGLLTPDKGSILLNNINIAEDPINAKKQFAFVPDDPNIFLRLKGIEYLSFLANIYDVPATLRKKRIDELAQGFGISDVLGQKIDSYSHGMRQKIILVGALLHDPSLWILDEPMTGLDPKASFHLKNLMRRHADSGNTVLFSTHVLDVAEKICDRLGVIVEGELLFVGTIAELKTRYSQDKSLETIFIDMVDDAENNFAKINTESVQ